MTALYYCIFVGPLCIPFCQLGTLLLEQKNEFLSGMQGKNKLL